MVLYVIMGYEINGSFEKIMGNQNMERKIQLMETYVHIDCVVNICRGTRTCSH